MTTVTASARRYALGLITAVYGFNFIDRLLRAILLPAIKSEFDVDDLVLAALRLMSCSLHLHASASVSARPVSRRRRTP